METIELKNIVTEIKTHCMGTMVEWKRQRIESKNIKIHQWNVLSLKTREKNRLKKHKGQPGE
jgi:hypothetical protein